MYTFKSLIQRCLDNYHKDINKIQGVIWFYIAFTVAKIVNGDYDGGEIKKINDKIVECKISKTKRSQNIFYELKDVIDNEHYTYVNEILEKLKDIKPSYYFEEMGNIKKIEGCIGVVLEE